jgi:hypothetical protein
VAVKGAGLKATLLVGLERVMWVSIPLSSNAPERPKTIMSSGGLNNSS